MTISLCTYLKVYWLRHNPKFRIVQGKNYQLFKHREFQTFVQIKIIIKGLGSEQNS